VVQDFEQLRSVLSKFAAETPRRAFLYRADGDQELEPEATGAFVLVGQTEAGRFVEIRGLQGELPANIRIEDDVLLISPAERPEDWQHIDDPDADALRSFSLLDPRTVGDLMDSAEFQASSDDETVASVHIDLGSLPGLPDEFREFLAVGSLDRQVELHFKGDNLVEMVQQDLYPRQTDRISERFEG